MLFKYSLATLFNMYHHSNNNMSDIFSFRELIEIVDQNAQLRKQVSDLTIQNKQKVSPLNRAYLQLITCMAVIEVYLLNLVVVCF